MKLRFGFILILLSLSPLASGAGDKKLTLVRKIQGLELIPPLVGQQLEKLTLQAVTKKPGLELLMSGDETPSASLVDIIAIESEVSRQKDGFRIEARLLDLKNKKLIKKVGLDKIREEDLIRLFQGALEALFIDYPPAHNGASPPLIEPPPRSAPPKKTANKVPRFRKNKPDKYSLDFKKRVRDLKFGVDDGIAETVAKEEAAANDSRKEEAKKNSSPNQDLKNVSGQTSVAEIKEPKEKKKYPSFHRLGLGWEVRSGKSEGLVGTQTSAQLLVLKGSGHFPLYVDGQVGASYEFNLGKSILGAKEFPTPYQAGVFGSWFMKNARLSAGLFRDRTFLISLEEPGEGIKHTGIAIDWMVISGEVNFSGWSLTSTIGRPLQKTTDFSSVQKASDWTANYFRFGVTPPLVVKNWESHIMIETVKFSTEGERPFTSNESRVALLFRRSL